MDSVTPLDDYDDEFRKEARLLRHLKSAVNSLSMDHTTDHRDAAYKEIEDTLERLRESTRHQIERKRLAGPHIVTLSTSAAIEKSEESASSSEEATGYFIDNLRANHLLGKPVENGPLNPLKAKSPRTTDQQQLPTTNSVSSSAGKSPRSPRESSASASGVGGGGKSPRSPRPSLSCSSSQGLQQAHARTNGKLPLTDQPVSVIRRPKTSYVYFVEEKSEEYRRAETNVHPAELLKLIGAQWKSISQDEKKKYYEMELSDDRRYSRELERAHQLRFSAGDGESTEASDLEASVEYII